MSSNLLRKFSSFESKIEPVVSLLLLWLLLMRVVVWHCRLLTLVVELAPVATML